MNLHHEGKKLGYLNKSYLFFHLKDKKQQEFEFHYHEFKKIIVFISGDVTYIIEGKAYVLKPWDILLVNNNDVHKPVISSDTVYERIIIWANSDFIEAHNDATCNLETCFRIAGDKKFNLIRLHEALQNKLKSLIAEMEAAEKSEEFGSKIISRAVFMQFLVYLNRIQLDPSLQSDKSIVMYDKQIEAILDYINAHLQEELGTKQLAQQFFISKYYLMHKFKKETGYTLHQYILQKRLSMALQILKEGSSITKACQQCGFKDYSSFLRLFKKNFKMSPREWLGENI